MSPALRLLFGFLLALLGAALALWLEMPLPWLLGPLLITAATRMAGAPTRSAPFFNAFGRWVIGLSLGLYFTPQVGASLLQNWPLMLISGLYALMLACVACWLYQRFGGMDAHTAWFAAAMGNASDMTHMAERHGARADQVASAHSVRVMLIVVIVPFAALWFGGEAAPSPPALHAGVHWGGLSVLVAGSALAGWLFERLRILNGWLLGPLFFAMVLTLLDVQLSALPRELSWAGQLCVGWSLGDKYRREFLSSAPRLVATASICTVFFIALSALLGWALAQANGMPASSMILAIMPGGIAEMTITAKGLGLDVPIVTAMQVSRMLIVVLATGWLWKRWARWANARKP